MSAKVQISTVAEVLKSNHLDPALLRRVIAELNLAAQPEGEEGEKAPPVKKQFTFLVSDPNGVMPKDDLVGWVIQVEESESLVTTQDKLLRAAYDYNQTKKGQLFPVKTLGEAIEAIPGRLFREQNVWPKHKAPVLLLRTNNEIPTTPTE